MKTNLTILFFLIFLLNLQAQDQQKGLKLNFVTALDFNMSKIEISADNWGIVGIKYD